MTEPLKIYSDWLLAAKLLMVLPALHVHRSRVVLRVLPLKPCEFKTIPSLEQMCDMPLPHFSIWGPLPPGAIGKRDELVGA